MGVVEKLSSLIYAANQTTGGADTDMTSATRSLIAGFGDVGPISPVQIAQVVLDTEVAQVEITNLDITFDAMVAVEGENPKALNGMKISANGGGFQSGYNGGLEHSGTVLYIPLLGQSGKKQFFGDAIMSSGQVNLYRLDNTKGRITSLTIACQYKDGLLSPGTTVTVYKGIGDLP